MAAVLYIYNLSVLTFESTLSPIEVTDEPFYSILPEVPQSVSTNSNLLDKKGCVARPGAVALIPINKP